MTSTNIHTITVLAIIAGVLWTCLWLRIWWMLGRMLRWKYLEMKNNNRRQPQQWTPPAPPENNYSWR